MSFMSTIAFARLNSSNARVTRLSKTSAEILSVESSKFEHFCLVFFNLLGCFCDLLLGVFEHFFEVFASEQFKLVFVGLRVCSRLGLLQATVQLDDCVDSFWAISRSRLKRSSKTVLISSFECLLLTLLTIQFADYCLSFIFNLCPVYLLVLV